ncbi:MAG: hypothetical protein ABEJ31_14700 [Haloarculaceae archaeon]
MMNLTRCSRTTLALALVVALLGATGTAAALSITASNAPADAHVGAEINTTVTIDDAYTDESSWTLIGETELQNVSWTVEEYDQGDRISQDSYGGDSFDQHVSSDPKGDELRVSIRGDVPEVPSYNYTNPEKENVTVVAIKQTTGNNTGTLQTYSVHAYTNDSRQARQAIDDAISSIDAAGGSPMQNDDIKSAISFYNGGQFQDAIRVANNAQKHAQSSQQTQTFIFGGIGVVVLALLVGGVWYWRNQQDDYDKLR